MSPGLEQPPHHVVGSDDPAALEAASRRRLQSHSCALAVICFLDGLTMATVRSGLATLQSALLSARLLGPPRSEAWGGCPGAMFCVSTLQ